MSDIARFNLILSLAVIAVGVSLYAGIAPPIIPVPPPVASPYCGSPLPAPKLEARAAYAYDITTEQPLFELHGDAQLPLASITKLMTALTALDTLKPDDIVTISRESLVPEGDSGLRIGDTWVTSDLISYSLITSSNDGIHALALASEAARGGTFEDFVLRMNEKAQSIGMTQSYFINDTGLDVSKNSPGALGSAHDIAILLTTILRTRPDDFSSSGEKQYEFTAGGRTFVAHNTNSVSAQIPEVIVSKTGFTDLAGGNLAILFEPLPGRPVAAVVLGSSREGRETDMLALTQFVRDTVKKSLLCAHNGN